MLKAGNWRFWLFLLLTPVFVVSTAFFEVFPFDLAFKVFLGIFAADLLALVIVVPLWVFLVSLLSKATKISPLKKAVSSTAMGLIYLFLFYSLASGAILHLNNFLGIGKEAFYGTVILIIITK